MKTYQHSTGTASVLEQRDLEECQTSEATWLPVTWQSPRPWTVPLQHNEPEHVFRRFPDNEPPTQGDAKLFPVTLAREYIEEHCRDDLSLEQVAGALHTPAARLGRLFEKATGIGFNDYIACVRVEKAKNLLLNCNYYFTEIAFELGFRSIRDFSRTFTRIVGEPPNAYRARLWAQRCCMGREPWLVPG